MNFNVHCMYPFLAALFFAPPCPCYGFASHHALVNLQQSQKTLSIFEKNGGFSPTWKRRKRSDKTKVALLGGTSIATSNGDPTFGGLATGILFIILCTAVGTFVFANQVYTPEIIEGAQMIRKSNRENEIRKLLEAVRSHQEDGKELIELRLPLETALGSTLEEYVAAVEGSEQKSDTIFTMADKDLVKILKQNV